MNNKKKKKSNKKRWIIMSLILILLIAVVIIIYKKGNDKLDKPKPEIEQSDIEFPYMTEEQLEISSLSTASMPNPDAGGEMGESTASLEVINKTGEFLLKAQIIVVLEDDTTFEFVINDLPEEGKVQAFEVDNGQFDDQLSCKSVKIKKIELIDEDVLMEDKILIQVREMKVTLTNISQSDLENLTVTCLCDMGDSYFGGTSYSYPVDRISSGASVTIDAIDCYLGEAKVVSVTVNN